MLSILALVLVALVTGGCSVLAVRESRTMKSSVRALVRGIEERTRPSGVKVPMVSESGDEDGPIPEDLGTVLDEAFQDENHGLAVLAVNDLTGRASVARFRTATFARGLSRICLLAGGGGAFALAALGGFERQSMIFAAGSVAMGVMSSFICHAFVREARGQAKRFAELTDILAREVEGHFRQVRSDEIQ